MRIGVEINCKEEGEKMKNNNAGFSMVELLIVIAVIAVLSVSSISAFGYLGMANASKCASEIDMSLSNLRSKNMAKSSSTYMYVYQYDDNYYVSYVEDTPGYDPESFTPNGDGEQIANSSVTVSFDDVPIDQDGEAFVYVSVRKKDGAYITAANPTSKFTISGQSSYNVVLVKNTGKHFKEAVVNDSARGE